MAPSSVSSALSQWIVIDGQPFAVEISRDASDTDWTVVTLDGIRRVSVWSGRFECEREALKAAVTTLLLITGKAPSPRTLKELA